LLKYLVIASCSGNDGNDIDIALPKS